VSARSRLLLLTTALAFAIVVLDQITKLAVRRAFLLGESKPVISSFFNLTYVRNTGAVWGWFQNQNEWLVLVSIAVLILIFLFQDYLVSGKRLYSAAMGLIMGGILGNLVDRVKLGWVTDFLDFYWNDNHWPSFNVADAAICAGVGLYLLVSLIPVFANKAVK
jgi:signal peptidase II